ncbi:MAG TPA: DUF547 domain-containing protein, partial [Thermoanaerobaculia bacterium]
CPPLRTESYAGARLSEQLDEQARRFLNGPHGVRLTQDGDELVVHTTKILDWFEQDFVHWGGGVLTFLRRYLPPDAVKRIDAAHGKVKIEYDRYDWALNDWR